MEIKDAPAVAFAGCYLFLVLWGLVWCIGELFARWRQANPKPRQWIYGTLHKPGDTSTNRPCRKCPKTGEVQFILWWAGEQGHTEHYWHATDSYWWPHFVAHPSEMPPS